MSLTLSRAFRLEKPSSVAFTGAGGKTTAIFRLARELDSPVLVTTTTHLGSEQARLADNHIICTSNDFRTDLISGVTLVTGPKIGERWSAPSPTILEWLREFGIINKIHLLIEADGARMKPLKAPGTHEPAIQSSVDVVVVVAGMSALGKPLSDEYVHRPRIYSRISGLALGEPITVESLQTVLCSPYGGLKNIPPNARRLALITQADTPEHQARARTLALNLSYAYHSAIITNLGVETNVRAVYERIAGIVLAAGQATRYREPKQLLDWHGESFIRSVARTALDAGLDPVLVISGCYADSIGQQIKDIPAQIVHNERWAEGQSTSIRAGIDALPPNTGAAIFLLADQPQVNRPVLCALREHHAKSLAPIIAPLVHGERANPVIFDRVTFSDLMSLVGDIGGRAIFKDYPVAYMPWHDDLLLSDIDLPEDYKHIYPT